MAHLWVPGVSPTARINFTGGGGDFLRGRNICDTHGGTATQPAMQQSVSPHKFVLNECDRQTDRHRTTA